MKHQHSMKRILFIFISCFIFLSCQEKKEEQGSEMSPQLSKVWGLHDEIMPRMGEIRSLKDQLTTLEDSLGTATEIVEAQDQLNAAKKDMNRWMTSFDLSKKEDTAYMDEQLIQLNKMKELFESSITNAEKIINTHK